MLDQRTELRREPRPEPAKPPYLAFCRRQSGTPDLRDRIAELAYLKAEHRGFEPGHELEDWLEAEVEIIDGDR